MANPYAEETKVTTVSTFRREFDVNEPPDDVTVNYRYDTMHKFDFAGERFYVVVQREDDLIGLYLQKEEAADPKTITLTIRLCGTNLIIKGGSLTYEFPPRQSCWGWSEIVNWSYFVDNWCSDGKFTVDVELVTKTVANHLKE